MKPSVKKILTVAVLSATSTGAYAGVVTPSGVWDGGGNHLSMTNTSLTKTAANSANNGWTDNSSLDYAAWGHQGSWYTFHTHMAADYTVSANSSGGNAPAFTLYRTDGEFDGGVSRFDSGVNEQSTAGNYAPHAFNQIGAAGDWGTYWMTDDSVTTTASTAGHSANGILETIGYANDGNAHAVNGFGGTTMTNDGNADGYAELTFSSLMHGWYVVFVSGADSNATGAAIDLNVSEVSAVPVPAAVYLFGSAIVGLFASSRRKLAEA